MRRLRAPDLGRVTGGIGRAENVLAAFALAGVMLLPLAEIVARKVFGFGIPGAGPFGENLTLWVGLLGAAIAAREGKLLTLATGELLPAGRFREVAHVIGGMVGAAVATVFAFGGATLVKSDAGADTIVAAGVRLWVVDLVFPVAFGLIALRLAWRASARWPGRAVAALGVAAGVWLALHPQILEGQPAWPWMLLVVVAGVLGSPIFALLGGIALFAFLVDGSGPSRLMIKAYEELTSPSLAAIPLFTLAGFALAEGKSSERLLRVFHALFGWAPGGSAMAAVVLCAFFTLFTGGSGVTILALGGLLLPALLRDGYRERFSIGLLTASGSLGLLFPLSLPLMLYGIVANVAIDDLFVGGLLPGLLMLGLMGGLALRDGLIAKVARQPFHWREAAAGAWGAKWELSLPLVVLIVLLGGYATPVESAAVAALYAILIQRFVHRDIPSGGALLRVMVDCVAIVGSVLVILALASGLTNYLVNAQVPMQLIDWTQAHVESRLVFLLGLNVVLLLVGCVMDIFSAIVVVAPLIIPLAQVYDVDPVHLGIIFIANLELGYLHPPIGLNLLLASVRFKKPVLEVTWATLPMLAILALGVLLITYWPWLTLGLLHWLRG
jgi:tripartite ATP-independent transporter DctM subunit